MKLGRQEGFTIVELVVALTVIAVGIFGARQCS
jgi:prepilin-type N-terminal cleavage/methylation domain-containing protein